MTGGLTVGIDLGTTNSAIATYTDSGVVVLETEQGRRTMPSVVSFTDSETAVVGKAALDRAAKHPQQTVQAVKRKMGEEDPVVTAGERSYRPEEISALVLKKLRSRAQQALNQDIASAVITVPAYFNHRQRKATIQAGQLAGLDVERIINEPTAACLAYGHPTADRERVLVYDLGGGTFDASLVDVEDGVFEVVGTNGLSHHGGDDWDARIVGEIRRIVREDTGVDVESRPKAWNRVWTAANGAKESLTHKQRTSIEIPFLLTEGRSDPYDFEETLTRAQFESITEELLEETIDACHGLLNDEEVSPEQIDNVLLVGGSTRMPQVVDRLEGLFGSRVSKQADPDDVVAKGAAVQAGRLANAVPQLPGGHRDSIEVYNDETGIETAPPPQELDDIVLVDVTGQTLGVKAVLSGVEDRFLRVVDRNTPVPATGTSTGTTVEDSQTKVKIEVYQGEASVASDNEFLGECLLEGLPPEPAGEVSVEVAFTLDENGTLDVEAVDKAVGNRASVRIASGVRFSQRELEERRAHLPVLSDG